MKAKKIIFFLFVLVSIGLVSCDSTTTNPEDGTATKGSINVKSSPAGAAIWINGANSNKVTPAIITDQNPGQITVSLFLEGYVDTVVTTNIVAGQEASVNISLTALDLGKYNDVTIWESADPSSDHPSGIDLSAGTAESIAGSNPDKPNIDIYYYSTGYVIASASLGSTMTRNSYFYVGASSDINDHVASPAYGGTGWTNKVPDNTTNYFFIYDQDGHYSKCKLSGLSASPTASLKVSWLYNKKAGVKYF